MDLKVVLKDQNFIDFMNYVSNMKIDVFETVNNDKAFGIKDSRFRINYNKVISNDAVYADCYLAYKQALQSLKDLYASYTSEFVSLEDFVVELYDKLKNYVVLNNVLPSNNIAQKRTLTPEEVKFYEAKRKLYIRNVLTQAIPRLNTLTAVKSLENADIESVANFIDKAETVVDDTIDNYGLDKTNEDIRNTILHEYLITYLPESYIQGDGLTTQKIEINKTRFSGSDAKYRDTPNHLQALAFLENKILADKSGLSAQKIAFDGFRFFNVESGLSCPINTFNLHRTELAAAERYTQSNFVLNEDFANALLTLPKRFVKINNRNAIKTTTVVDGDTIETIKLLYRKSYIKKNHQRNYEFDDNLTLGNFCKVKEFNKTKGTYSYMLYYIPDQNAALPIQLFRIDKVEDTYRGAPASHNLRGKEKIETTLHTHTYNLIDAVLKNLTKDESLGKMDLSHIFPTTQGLDPKIIEEYFDYFCGIHGNYLKRVNQQKFAPLFKKYKPIEFGME